MFEGLSLSSLALKGLAVLAVVAAVAGALWYAYSEGKASERGKQATQVVKTQQRINKADAKGPRTATEVDNRLKEGTF